MSIFNKSRKAILWFIVQRGASFWLFPVLGTIAMTYFAMVAEIAENYAPFSYAVISLISFLLIVIGLVLYAWFRKIISSAIFEEKRSLTTVTNVLAPSHINEIINLTDFYHPFYRPTENVRFENCEFIGPAFIFFNGGSITNGVMNGNQIVIVRGDRALEGVVHFSNCTFINCRFYRVTWAMNFEIYKSQTEEMRLNMPVISDGTTGDI